MGILKNITIQQAQAGFFLSGRFIGIEHDVTATVIQGGGTIRLIPVTSSERYIELDINSLTLLDTKGFDITPADMQQRADLLSVIVAKRFISGIAQGVSGNNPLPVTDVDNYNRISRNTVFGDKIVAVRLPQIAAQFQYPLAANDARPPILVNDGTILQENALLKINTAAQVGSSAIIRSSETIRYIPGYECYVFATPDFNAPVAGQLQLVGALDENTGFGWGYNGLDFVFVHRRAGVTQYFTIDLSSFEKKNGYTFNPQKGNVYLLSYGYLGYAPARLEVIPPSGGLAALYKFNYVNEHDQTHLDQTFLPVSIEMSNNAGSIAMTTSVGSVNAGIISDGTASEYTFTRSFNYFTPSDIAIVGNTELASFRSKTTFGGIANYVKSRLFNFNVAQELNKNSVIVIFKNPTILNTPTWVDIDIDSTLEISNDVEVDFTANNETFYTQALFKVDTLDKEVEKFKFDLPPGGIAVFAILTSGLGDARFSNFWKELF